MEDEKQEGEKKIVSISLISVVQTKVGEQFGGRMYVEIEVEVNKFQVTMNTGADNVYIAKELVEEINLPYKKERATWKELIQRVFQFMGLLEVLTFELGHGEVRST